MARYGKVLWYRSRDGLGVVIDSTGCEFYLYKSVVPKNIQLKKGQYVKFWKNNDVTDVLCVGKLQIPKTKKSLNQVLQKFDIDQKQLQLPLGA